MPLDDDLIRKEIVRLRDWRHDVADPKLSAAIARAMQLAKDLDVVRRRLDEVEAKVERMARADEIAEAVTDHARKSRRGILNAWEKIVLGAAALAGVVNIVLNSLHH